MAAEGWNLEDCDQEGAYEGGAADFLEGGVQQTQATPSDAPSILTGADALEAMTGHDNTSPPCYRSRAGQGSGGLRKEAKGLAEKGEAQQGEQGGSALT